MKTQRKLTAAQQQLLDADNRLRAINKKRREMFLEEENAAKQDKAKAENAIRRENALAILRPLRDKVSSGQQVTGTRRSSFSISMIGLKNINKPSCDFVVTNVHIGRKHFGVHVKYEGSQKQHWVRVQQLHDQNHALHDGTQWFPAQTNTRQLRELVEGGEA
jgi:hypothetical protein